MGKYRLIVNKTHLEMTHDGYCSNPDDSVLVSDSEWSETIHIAIPNYELIENYSDDIGVINELGREELYRSYKSCCGSRTKCTSAYLIKLIEGGWINCFRDTFLNDPVVIAKKKKMEEDLAKKEALKQQAYKDRRYLDQCVHQLQQRNYGSANNSYRCNTKCKFGEECRHNTDGRCLYKH